MLPDLLATGGVSFSHGCWHGVWLPRPRRRRNQFPATEDAVGHCRGARCGRSFSGGLRPIAARRGRSTLQPRLCPAPSAGEVRHGRAASAASTGEMTGWCQGSGRSAACYRAGLPPGRLRRGPTADAAGGQRRFPRAVPANRRHPWRSPEKAVPRGGEGGRERCQRDRVRPRPVPPGGPGAAGQGPRPAGVCDGPGVCLNVRER